MIKPESSMVVKISKELVSIWSMALFLPDSVDIVTNTITPAGSWACLPPVIWQQHMLRAVEPMLLLKTAPSTVVAEVAQSGWVVPQSHLINPAESSSQLETDKRKTTIRIHLHRDAYYWILSAKPWSIWESMLLLGNYFNKITLRHIN